jgi:hypothetical protein
VTYNAFAMWKHFRPRVKDTLCEESGEPGKSPFEAYGHLLDLPQGAIIGAGYAPGFATDLTGWRIFMSEAGRVRQEVRHSTLENGYSAELRVYESDIGPQAVTNLLAAARRAGFYEMAAFYHSGCTDQETISVVVRLPSGLYSVGADGAMILAAEGNREAAALIDLWRSIQKLPWRPPWWPDVYASAPAPA